MGIKGRYCLALIYAVVLAFFAVDFSFAKPQGGVATYGNVTINQNPGNNISTLITQTSQKGIIDWQSFSIAEYERVHFAQPNAAAITLNRVLGGDVSNIFGKLSATGQVFIINPSGILFGPNAIVDVAGLIATTANISNADFLSDKYFFVQGSNNNAKVINQGYIKVADSGLVALIAPGVENSGIIEANLGKVVLGSTPSTSTFIIDFYGDELINFTIPTETNANLDTPIVQSGKIIAYGGKVLLTVNSAKNIVDRAINMSGIIEANTASMQGGSVVLQGGSKGVVSVTGQITARGNQAGESGGTVKITGEKVGLFSGTMIDVSGQAGGGKVLVGADYQNGTVVPASSMVYVNEGATILANALGMGNGGNVIIWSNDSTWFYGTVFAKGGPEGGSGGSLETSGNWLDVYNSVVDLTAPSGEVGTWLIDPYDVYIVGGSGTSGGNWTPGWFWSPGANNTILYANDIVTHLNSADVSINTGSGGSQAGNITVNSGANISYSGAIKNLYLTAANSITMNTGSTIGGNLNLYLMSGNNMTLRGLVNVSGNMFFQTTGSGNISLYGMPSGSSLLVVGPASSLLMLQGFFGFSTSGSQNYQIPVLLGSDTLLSSSSSISFGNTVSSIGGPFNLTVNTSGSTTFSGVLSSLRNLTTNVGGNTIIGANVTVTTSGSQTYNDVVLLQNNTIFTSTGSGDIKFASGVSNIIGGPYNLTVNTAGNTIFSGILNSLQNLTTNVGGNTIVGGSITTSGSQTYNDAVLLQNDTTLTGSNITFNSTVDSISSAKNLTISNTPGNTSFNGAVGATNPLLNLITSTSGNTILSGGIVKTNQTQNYNNPVYLGNNTVLNSTNGGDIHFFSTLNNSAYNLTINTTGNTFLPSVINLLGSLTTDTGGNTIIGSGGSITTSGSQVYNDTVLLQNDTSFSGSNITFYKVDSYNSTAYNLSVAGGVVNLGTVGATNSLLNLVSGVNTIIAGNVTTIGTQFYLGPVFVAGGTLTGSSITFQNSVNGNGISSGSLGINATGNVYFMGPIGNTIPLGSLTISGGSIYMPPTGNVITQGLQSYNNGTIFLQGPTNFISTGIGNNITFGSNVSVNGSNYPLTVNTSGSTIFAGVLNSLNILITDVGGNTIISNGNISTSGPQTYNDAVLLQNDTTLTGSHITFNGTVDSNTTPSNLTVNASADTLFNGAIGVNLPLLNLVINASDFIVLSGGTIITQGAQTYNMPLFSLILGADTLLTSTNAGDISFLNVFLDGGAHNLTINTSGNTILPLAIMSLKNLTTDAGGNTIVSSGVTTSGSQTYNDVVLLPYDTIFTSTGSGNISFTDINGISGPFNLTVNTNGSTTFSGILNSVQNLVTDIGGNTIINSNSVNTSASQTYNDAVLLQADTVFSSTGGNDISFSNAVDSFGVLHNLTINTSGNTLFNGAIGVNLPLLNLVTSASGNTILSGGTIITQGAQTYGNPLYLGADTLLTSTNAGTINFISTLNSASGGPYNLTINTTGVIFLPSIINTLQNLITGFPSGTVYIDSGGILSTSGSQTYNDNVILQNDTTFISTGSGNIGFGNTLSTSGGAYNLTVNTSGNTVFSGILSSLYNLVTDAGGNTILGGSISTFGFQSYNDAVFLQADTVLNSMVIGGGDILFGNTVDSFNTPHSLTINTFNNIFLNGAIGVNLPLLNLVINAGGNTVLSGGTIITQGAQTYNGPGPLYLGADTRLTSTNAGDIGFYYPLSLSGGSYNLTINTSGSTILPNNITLLKNLTTDAGGNTIVGFGGSVTTSESQTYNDAVLLQTDTVFTSTGGNDISFGNIDSFFGPVNLTINTSGNTLFNGAIGVNLSLLNLITSSGGNTILSGGTIITRDAQTYNNPLYLGADTVLTSTGGSGIISFISTLSSSGGPYNLTINNPTLTFLPNVITSLKNLVTDAPGVTIIGSGGIVTTSGLQNYNDNVVLQNNTIFTSTGSGDIKFGSGVVSGGTYNLTVNTTGNTIFSGILSSLQNLITDIGGRTIIGGNITTSGLQNYNDAVLLQNDITLTGSNITFSDTVDSNTSAKNLTVNVNSSGIISFNGAVGAANPLLNLIISTNGTTNIRGGSIRTSQTQIYNNPIHLLSNTSLFSNAGTIIFNSTLDSIGGPYDLSITAPSSFTLPSVISSLHNLTTSGGPVTIGSSGSVNTTGSQTYNNAVLLQTNTIFTSTGSGNTGNISFGSTVTSSGPYNLTVNTAGNTIFSGILSSLQNLVTNIGGNTIIGGGSVNTTGSQTYNDAVFLQNDTTLTGSNITFNGTVDSNTTLFKNLTINVNTPGITNFNGAVGATNQLKNLLVTNTSGTTIIRGGSVKTNQAQTYNGPVVLQNNTIFTSTGSGDIKFGNTLLSGGLFNLTVNTAGNTIFSGILSSLQNLITDIGGRTIIGGNITTSGLQNYNDAVLLQNDITLTGSNITFSGTVDSNTSAKNLTVNVNSSGIISFNGPVGAANPLLNLITSTNGTTNISGGSIRTSQTQTYNNPIHLLSNTSLFSSAGTIIFNSTLDSSGGPYDLSITAPSSFTLPSVISSLHNLTTSGGPVTIGSSGSVNTTGSQTYNNAVLLQTNTTFTSTGSGNTGNISFGSTVTSSGPYNLTVNTAGNTIFSGILSSLQNLVTNIGGNTIIGGGSVNTTGSQTYNDAVFLQNDTTLTGSNITFNGTVDSNTTLFKNLTINVNTPSGVTSFNGAVGATNQLKNLLVTNTSGTTIIRGGSVKTNQAQTYNGLVVLQNNTIFTSTGSGDIKFGNTLLSGGFFNLTVNTAGNTIFSGILSSLQNLITDIGGNTIIGGNITTFGSQTYNDAVRLQNDTLLTAGVGSNITFNATVDSINNSSLRNLTINAPGNTSFNGAVGTTYRLSNLNTSTSGNTILNGGSVTTNQTQNYNNPVSLGNDTVLSSTNGGDIHFFNALNNSSYNLTINTTGNTFLPSVINLLGSLTTDVGGNTIMGSGGSITTSGSQTYNDAVLLQSNTNLAGSSVLFNNTVDSYNNTTSYNLTVNTSGGVTFANTVGGTNQLLNLTTNANNTTIGGNVTTAGSQTYNNAVLLQSDAIFTSTGSGDINFGNNVSGFGFRNLTVNTAGNTIFSGILSSLQNLITDVGGNTIIGGGNVSTLGSQTYNDAVLLQAHTVFTSTGSGNIAFANTVNSFDGTPFNLTVNTAGDISFLGALGTINAVLDLVANGGTTIIGNTINTLGNQTYNNPVLITGNALLNAGGNIFFGNTINGAGIPGNLVITTLGNLTFLGTIGVINPLASLSITASNIPISSTVSTIGAQVYNGPLALNANTSLSGGSITFNNAITGSFGLILNTGSGDIFFNGPVGSFNAPLSGLQILNANNVNAFGQIFTNSFAQSAGSGTTNFAVLLFSGTGGVGSYVPGTGNGPILIITNNVTGIIDTGSLDLLTQAANLTGYLNGQAAPQGITNIVLLNTIGPGTHFWGGVDMFFSPIPPVPPIPPAPPVPPVPSVITNKFISDVARILEGATRLWRQNITCVNHGSEVLYFKKDGSLDRLYFTGPVTICK